MDYEKLISRAAAQMRPSGIRKFFDIAAEMKDCISLGVGEPDFKTPWAIRQAGIQSLEKGRTWYTSNSGLKELRQEICSYLDRRFDLHYTEDQTLVTVGGSEAIDMCIRALVEPGDEVIIPEPCFEMCIRDSNAADDHDDQGQGRQSAQSGNAQVLPVKFAGGTLVAFFLGEDDGRHHAAQRPDDAGHISRQEQGSNRGSARRQRIGDQRVGRGNQQARGRRSTVGGCAQSLVITPVSYTHLLRLGNRLRFSRPRFRVRCAPSLSPLLSGRLLYLSLIHI